MKPYMMAELDAFFAKTVIGDVNRDSYLVCNLRDKEYKITISLVFMRDWHSIESDSYNLVTIGGKGAVVTLPAYWVSIPKELSMGYFQFLIDNLYETEIDDWFSNTGNGNGNNGSNVGMNGCPCKAV